MGRGKPKNRYVVLDKWAWPLLLFLPLVSLLLALCLQFLTLWLRPPDIPARQSPPAMKESAEPTAPAETTTTGPS